MVISMESNASDHRVKATKGSMRRGHSESTLLDNSYISSSNKAVMKKMEDTPTRIYEKKRKHSNKTPKFHSSISALAAVHRSSTGGANTPSTKSGQR